MPVFQLPEDPVFPHPSLASEDGLLAIGGDLSTERLLNAYANGIFPWYSDDTPILWWSPDPRLVLRPEELKVSKSLRQVLRSGRFRVSADTAFEQVIQACAGVPRKEEDGTWIVPEMIGAYIRFHQEGYAHSVEVWKNEELCGGLYGVSIGGAFFGESMFHSCRDASKVALYHLCRYCNDLGIKLIDAQVHTQHLERMGARLMPREEFLEELADLVRLPGTVGKWRDEAGGG
ncbi:MAG: leucyl/phenylalanyl-tRNA--protein transferase [Bacteroidales bacterium]|nr:leucyl/phenylalanyl-tRNA--protein transferase [Bacteroidales bacterium]